jgi:hypothetical protein
VQEGFNAMGGRHGGCDMKKCETEADKLPTPTNSIREESESNKLMQRFEISCSKTAFAS